jgi:hypothetical protein
VGNSGKQLFISVDEYDAPANAAIFSSMDGLYTRITALFKASFFQILKDAISTGIVMKYWLTGVLPAFRDGISPLLAVEVISDKPQYHGLCGLTDTEVQTIAETYLSSSPLLRDIHSVMHTLRHWHNGYRFHP